MNFYNVTLPCQETVMVRAATKMDAINHARAHHKIPRNVSSVGAIVTML